VIHAVRSCLPRGPPGRQQNHKAQGIQGTQHPHAGARQSQALEIKVMADLKELHLGHGPAARSPSPAVPSSPPGTGHHHAPSGPFEKVLPDRRTTARKRHCLGCNADESPFAATQSWSPRPRPAWPPGPAMKPRRHRPAPPSKKIEPAPGIPSFARRVSADPDPRMKEGKKLRPPRAPARGVPYSKR